MPRKSKSEKKLSPSAAKLRLLKRLRCTMRYEKKAWDTGAHLVAGVDEVGRGSLFGPVVAGAVILDSTYRIRGLRDSKLLLRERREVLAERIREHAIAWSIAAVDVARIDQINIYHASRLAMRIAVSQLAPQPTTCSSTLSAWIVDSPSARSFTATLSPPPSPPLQSWRKSNAIA